MNERTARMRRSKNYNGKTFRNRTELPTMVPNSTLDMLQKQFTGREQRYPPGPLPLAWPGAHAHAQPPDSGLRVTWLGHSTLLLELDGVVILSDPVWAARVSPVSFVGPRRFHPPPIPLDQLPRPDLILISHDHYDHLDRQTIRYFARDTMPFVTALGVGAHLEAWGIGAGRIHELDWGEELALPALGLTINAVPAQHFSGRGLRRNATLWSSWVVSSAARRIFVGCDSGLFDGFAEIGERYGPFDLASLEIAQYGAGWPHIHMTPEQSIAACLALRANVLLPVHWGTFCLSFHAWDEPIERLLAAAAEHKLRVITPQLGEPVEPASGADQTPWWRSVSAAP